MEVGDAGNVGDTQGRDGLCWPCQDIGQHAGGAELMFLGSLSEHNGWEAAGSFFEAQRYRFSKRRKHSHCW